MAMRAVVKRVYWQHRGDVACDFCNRVMDDQFTDGKTKHGPWAIMCNDCLPYHSIATRNYHGQGLGQQYTLQATGRWLKTEG